MSEYIRTFIIDGETETGKMAAEILENRGYVLDISSNEDASKIQAIIKNSIYEDCGPEVVHSDGQIYSFSYESSDIKDILNKLYVVSDRLGETEICGIASNGSSYNELFKTIHSRFTEDDFEFTGLNVSIIDDGKGYYIEIKTDMDMDDIQIYFDGEKYHLMYSFYSELSPIEESTIHNAENLGFNFEHSNIGDIKEEVFKDAIVDMARNNPDELANYVREYLPHFTIYTHHFGEDTIFEEDINENVSVAIKFASLDSDVAKIIKEEVEKELKKYDSNYEYQERNLESRYLFQLETVKDSLEYIITYCDDVIESGKEYSSKGDIGDIQAFESYLVNIEGFSAGNNFYNLNDIRDITIMNENGDIERLSIADQLNAFAEVAEAEHNNESISLE